MAGANRQAATGRMRGRKQAAAGPGKTGGRENTKKGGNPQPARTVSEIQPPRRADRGHGPDRDTDFRPATRWWVGCTYIRGLPSTFVVPISKTDVAPAQPASPAALNHLVILPSETRSRRAAHQDIHQDHQFSDNILGLAEFHQSLVGALRRGRMPLGSLPAETGCWADRETGPRLRDRYDRKSEMLRKTRMTAT